MNLSANCFSTKRGTNPFLTVGHIRMLWEKADVTIKILLRNREIIT